MKKANQSQEDTDMEDRNYDAPAERAPRMDLRRDNAPVRDDGDHKDSIKKREDLGGTSVYKKKLDKAHSVKPKSAQEQQSDQSSGRNVAGFKPTPENFENICKIEAKLDVCLKFLSQAMHDFYALKSIDISPDGKLGGRGFILEIPEVRARLHAAVESISGLIDTIYDETRGKHWDFNSSEDESQEPAPEQNGEPEAELNDDFDESDEFSKVSSIISQVKKKAEGGK